jgi:hypothetical protein
MNLETIIVWYASGGGITETGPFETQKHAYAAMRLTTDAQEAQRKKHGTCSPYPYDLVVWPVLVAS